MRGGGPTRRRRLARAGSVALLAPVLVACGPRGSGGAATLPPRAASASAASSAAEPARAFVTLVRGDTLAVEEVRVAGDTVWSRMYVRPQQLLLATMLVRDGGGEVRAASVEGRADGRAEPVLRQGITVVGDSARVADGAGATTAARTLAVGRDAVPMVNLSMATLELVVRRARAGGGDSARVPVVLLPVQRAGALQALVTRVGTDTVVVTLAGVALRAAVDARGRITGAAVPAQGVRFERATPGAVPLAAAPRDYGAPAGAPYVAENVTVVTPDGLSLAGTLTVPRQAGAAQRVPAVVLISGSGPQDRDNEISIVPGYRFFRQVADTLSRRGIAVLRLDDRGVGASSLGPPGVTSADLAGDVEAAVRWLRERAEVDPARVGLVGHSEGGMIAPMVAARDSAVRAIVLLAGPARTGRAILEEQRRRAVEQDARIAPAARDSVLAAARGQAEGAYAANPWLRYFVAYDPLPTARRVRQPVLILQGETDRQVSAPQAAELAAALRDAGNRDVTVRVFPATNHLFLPDPVGDFAGYPALPERQVRPVILGTLADWLVARLGGTH